MTTVTKRQKLISYLADADDSKVKAIYTLLEKDIEEEEDVFVLSDEQMQILEKEHEMYMKGKGKSYTREEARQIIKGQRGY
jgi:hypothetical protein